MVRMKWIMKKKIFAQTVEVPPGTVWAYASVPVDMLSLVIENVSGQKMGDFFNEYINNVIGTAPIEWGKFGGHTGRFWWTGRRHKVYYS